MKISDRKERLLWVDVLNICACVSVVFLHCTNGQVHNFNGNFDLRFFIGALSHSFALWGVPVFLMISGYNLLGYTGSWKRFYERRFSRAVVPFLLWSAFYCFAFHQIKHCLTEEFSSGNFFPFDFRTFIEMFLNGKFNAHMWFFVPLFALYLSVPFLSVMVKNLSIQLLKLFLVFSFVFISVLPFIFSLCDLNVWSGTLFPIATRFFIFAVSGYALPLVLQNCNKKIFYFAGLFCAVIQFTLLFLAMYYKPDIYRLFLSYTGPTNFIISISVFLFFMEYNWESLLNKLKVKRETVQKISSCSLGVYLFHATVIVGSGHLNLHLANPYFGFVVVYLVSLVIVYIMKKVRFLNIMVP